MAEFKELFDMFMCALGIVSVLGLIVCLSILLVLVVLSILHDLFGE